MKKALLYSFTILFVPTIFAGDVSLAWDPSSTPGITNYVLYAHTNALSETNLTSATIKANAGTNLSAKIVGIKPPSQWYFVATAVKDGVQSDPSNMVVVQVPNPPTNSRIIAIQYGITLTNFVDTGFFRLYIPAVP